MSNERPWKELPMCVSERAELGVKIDGLYAEVERLRVQVNALGNEAAAALTRVKELEAANAELRARLDDASQFCDKSVEKMTAKIDKLKARLAWFERRDEKLAKRHEQWMKDYEAENPKPEGA
jgi:phage shock protein A